MCFSTGGDYSFDVSYSNYYVKNEVYLMSISHCYSLNYGYHLFYITMGYAKLQTTNSSKNNGTQNHGNTMYSQQSTTSSYNTISNNNNSDGLCIRFFDCFLSGYFNYFNIIQNKCINNGIVHVASKILEIYNSNFVNNIGILFICDSILIFLILKLIMNH